MPKAPRDKASATPVKRTRKTTSKAAQEVGGDDGKGAVTQSVAAAPLEVQHAGTRSSLEEQIRARAYELYLQRRGHGGTPEQDWFRAQQEICGQGSRV
jgi:hypothetical protein